MSRRRVLCMLDLSGAPEGLAALREVADVDLRTPDRETLLAVIGDYDALWTHVDLVIDDEVLGRARRLKVINTASTGTDHIDRAAASRGGIRILSITKDYDLLDNFTATAECAWMLLLACHRHFRGAVRHVLEGGWKQQRFTGRQLSDETLGVLGIGRLGRMTVEYGKAFRMRVLGCDREPFHVPDVESVDFDTLLAESDALSLHVHMLPENYHLFDEEAFAKMKRGAILVNTSRGDLVDETALIAALESGKLAAFGTDVLHNEWRRDMRESPLVRYAQDHENVIITPHMGGATHRSLWEARDFSAKKLAHYLATGEELTCPPEDSRVAHATTQSLSE